MKATIKFTLPEDYVDYTTCNNAGNLSSIIWDLDQWLRENYKYDKGDISIDAAEKVREQLREIMDDNNLSFNSPIFS